MHWKSYLETPWAGDMSIFAKHVFSTGSLGVITIVGKSIKTISNGVFKIQQVYISVRVLIIS